MKVLIDVQALQSPLSSGRGIGRYARGLIRALCESRPDWDIVAVEHDALPRLGPFNELRHCLFKDPLARAQETNELNARFYGDWLTAQKPDVCVLLHTQDKHVLLPRFTDPHPRMAGVLYDVIPLLFADQYLRDGGVRNQYAEGFRTLCACQDILAISDASADDFRRIAPDCGDRLTVIGGAVDQYFSPGSDDEAAPEHLPLCGDFLLYVGGFDFRKNWKIALEAYASLPFFLRARLSFVMACGLEPAERDMITGHGAKLGIANNLHLTGRTSDLDLRSLYRHCRLLFFPSLYEGVGLPVLEALACGAPVVTSNGSSLGQCGGNVSWLVDPGDVVDCCRGLREALAEPRQTRLQERLHHAAEFSWRRVGDKVAHCFERRAPARSASQRRRVAWISPMPPAQTGVADYSALLVEALRDRYELDVITDNNSRCDGYLSAADAISSHQSRPYDAFVYQLGNSRFHAYMLPLMARYRGLVTLHDLHFDGLLQAAIAQRIWSRSLVRELELSGEPSLAHALECGEITEYDAAQPFRPLHVGASAGSGVFGAGRPGGPRTDSPPFPVWLLSRASRVIVHSAWTRNALSAWTDRPLDCIPLPLLPGDVEDPLAARSRLGISPGRFVLVTLGTVGTSNRVPSILKAVDRLPPAVRAACRLYIVGLVPGMLGRELTELAHSLALSDQVVFTGRLPAKDFSAYAKAADLCVQLRHPTRGESSAALLQALAAGAPCLISSCGPAEDIPSEAACRIRPGQYEIDDLVRAILRLFHDRQERHRLGHAAATYAAEAHSLPAIVPAYEQAIELAIADRKDFAWLETACQALSCLSCSPPNDLFNDWAGLRTLGTAN
jgi:glycosyltransferase involved in cell wall biosynthesis